MYDKISNMILTGYYNKNNDAIKNKNIYERYIKPTFVILLYIKYLCDKGITSYDDVIINKNYSFLDEQYKNDTLLEGYFNDCLSMIRYHDLRELIGEFLDNNQDSEVELLNIFLEDDDKVLYYVNRNSMNSFRDYMKKDIGYLETGLFKTFGPFSEVMYYKLLDEMLDIKREYHRLITRADIKNYDAIIINDEMPEYRFKKYDSYMFKNILDALYAFDGKVILKTTYSNINKIEEDTLIKRFISKIIINEDINKSVYVIFKKMTNVFDYKKDDHKISIILLNEKNIHRLEEIIKNDKIEENVLIKVEPSKIIENNNRIGFSIYQNKDSKETRRINEIIDDNKRIMKQLKTINDVISEEMDKLNEIYERM